MYLYPVGSIVFSFFPVKINASFGYFLENPFNFWYKILANGISLTDFFVFGDVIITFVLFLLIYILCIVCLILIFLFSKSMSDHLSAHTSPILKPVYILISIPTFFISSESNM